MTHRARKRPKATNQGRQPHTHVPFWLNVVLIGLSLIFVALMLGVFFGTRL